MRVLVGAAAGVLASLAACTPPASEWTAAEREHIQSLRIDRLGPPAADPTNAQADSAPAADLGQRLFGDPRLSRNGQIACISCHQPQRYFSDGLPLARGLGQTRRNAPSLLGVAYSPWLFRDGRADSLWSQALGPLEHPQEMGLTRTALAHRIAAHYRAEYEAIFGALPPLHLTQRFPAAAGPQGDTAELRAWQRMAPDDRRAINRVAAQVGKALAAYERRLRPGPARFDEFAGLLDDDEGAARRVLDPRERRGLKLFLGRGQCLRCHLGPLLSNQQFHNTGLEPPDAPPADRGRSDGVPALLASDFNCRSPHNDAAPAACPHLDFLRPSPEWVGAFRTPSLRNVAATAPYMHDGRFATLREVLDHYNRAPQLFRKDGHTELFPLGLDAAELDALEAFLRTLTEVRADGAQLAYGMQHKTSPGTASHEEE